jgi:hypothetical protein
MQQLITIFLFLLCFSCCTKHCPDLAKYTDPCSTENLVITDSIYELRKFVYRDDSSSLIGHASAIKSIEGAGAIEWVANNQFVKANSTSYYLQLNTFKSKQHIDLADWAYRREYMGITFNPYVKGEQLILSDDDFKKDNSKNCGYYYSVLDDISLASWDIDTTYKNIVIVTKLDTINKVIEGTFDLNFKFKIYNSAGIKDFSKLTNSYRCGKFKAKITGW